MKGHPTRPVLQLANKDWPVLNHAVSYRMLQLDRQWYTVSIYNWSWFCKVCIHLVLMMQFTRISFIG
uniref:Uncharacterized protein n=1 Tax=Hyaloperonospora arabidopsidis (strain Emoy2) TaxID=559515 RepID=M4B244_HYAAE